MTSIHPKPAIQTRSQLPPLIMGLGAKWSSRMITLALIALLTLPLSQQLYFSDSNTAESFAEANRDIYAIYVEGMRVADGDNPYTRIHEGDMRKNKKYPTYFPLIYYYFAGIHWLGATSWEAQFKIWSSVYLISYFLMGVALFAFVRLRGGYLLALTSVLLVLYSRWGLYVTEYATTDASGIWPMIVALHMLARSRQMGASLFLGLSIAIKHLAIFVAPLFAIIAVFHSTDRKPTWGRGIWVCAAIAALPVLLSLPFLVDDPAGIFKSILFSATRDGTGSIKSMDALTRLDGLVARLPMVGMLVICYIVAIRQKVPAACGALLIMSVFLGFNSVYFPQYQIWIAALVPCAIAEAVAMMALCVNNPNEKNLTGRQITAS